MFEIHGLTIGWMYVSGLAWLGLDSKEETNIFSFEFKLFPAFTLKFPFFWCVYFSSKGSH